MRKPTPKLLWLLRFVLLASATLLGLCVSARAQHTTRIPAESPTIQAAIDAAHDGDTLLVAPGTYFENLDLHGKALTLQSTEGPAVTILDGRNLAPTLSLLTHETRATTISGFTVRNGAPATSTTHGGGILIDNAAPTLKNLILTQNLCTALSATSAPFLLQDSTVTHTRSTPLCAAQPVAPIVLEASSATLDHNLIERNDLSQSAAQPLAGAIALLNSPATLQANIIRFNQTSGDAPSALALVAGSGATLLQQNLIVANRTGCAPAVSLTLQTGPLQFLNNTIADNLTGDACLDAELSLPPHPQHLLIANNIVAASASHPALACSDALPAASFHHNLLDNSAGPILSPTCPPPPEALLADPLFANRAQSDYHLAPHSPALDAGVPALAPPRDLDDAPRLQHDTLDLGPYEHATPRVLDPTTTLLAATPSPAEAFQSITLTALVTTSQSPTPTGSVTFTANTLILATLPLDATGRAAFTTTTLAATTYTLLATYSGSATLAPSTSAPLAEPIHPATVLLSFALTPSSADQTQTVTLSTRVQSPLSTRIPTGQVQFLALHSAAAPTLLATVTLDATGLASTTLPTMPSGTYLIDAAYLGTPDFAAVTLPSTAALTLSLANRGYALTAASSTLAVASGHHAPLTLALTSFGTFAGPITLSCTGLPANATCAFSPAAPTLTPGASLPITLTLDTNAIPGFLAQTHPAAPTTTLAALSLASLFLLGRMRRRRLALVFPTLLLAALSFTGCSGKYPDQVPAGTYQIHILSQSTGTNSQTIPITLVVTQ